MQEPRYLSRESLALETTAPGVKMWGVALEKAQLTYFEVAPDTRFETHSHDSEQITLVLAGELYFQFADRTVCARSGEVVAVPSNVPHAVFTRETPAKAVDAWSPVLGSAT